MASKGKDYYRNWYAENADSRNTRRRNKYASDPTHREKVLECSRDSRRRSRNDSMKVKRFQTPRSFDVNGSVVNMYSVGALAQMIGRSVQSITNWEKSGTIPVTPYRDNQRGFRYYTSDMIKILHEEVGKSRRLYPVDPEMCKRITDRWKTSGVPMDGQVVTLGDVTTPS